EADADAVPGVGSPKGALDGDGAIEGAAGGGEGGHDAVAGVLDLAAAVGLERVADDGVVGAEDILGGGVAEAAGKVGRAFYIGEENGDESGRSRGCALGRAPPRAHQV